VTTRPSGQPAPPGGVIRRLLALPAYLYRAHLGFLFGHRFLILVHEGRRTHLRRETPLEVMAYNPANQEAIVAAGWGWKTGWLHNVEGGLAREVWIAGTRYRPVWRRLEVDEAVAVLERYERHSGLPAVVVRTVLGRLLGWPYDGTPAARRRAAEQLPLLAFRPAAEESSGPWQGVRRVRRTHAQAKASVNPLIAGMLLPSRDGRQAPGSASACARRGHDLAESRRRRLGCEQSGIGQSRCLGAHTRRRIQHSKKTREDNDVY